MDDHPRRLNLLLSLINRLPVWQQGKTTHLFSPAEVASSDGELGEPLGAWLTLRGVYWAGTWQQCAAVRTQEGEMRVPEQTNCSRMASPCRETCAGNSPGAASLPPRIRPVGPSGPGCNESWDRKAALAWVRQREKRSSRGDMAATGQMAAAHSLSPN